MADTDVLRLSGELDASSVPALAMRLRAAAVPTSIDFSAVTGIDSAGVAFVRTLQARAAAAGRPLPTLQNVPAHYHQLIAAHRVRPWE